MIRNVLATALVAAAVLVGAPAQAQAPDWSVDAAAYSSSMSITAAAFSAGSRLESENDWLAAFVDGEIRGAARATVVGGETLFFLSAYANGDGETLTFRLCAAADDQIVDVIETVTFVTNAIVGDVSSPKTLTAVGGTGSNRPAWSVDPAAFSSTMNIIAELFIGGTASSTSDGLIGAFVGGEVRGVASPILVGGRWLFFLTVYADSNGETVSFQAFDPAQDAVVGVDEERVFTVDAVVGSTSTPFSLNAGSASGLNRPAWSLDPTAFESTMSVVAALFTDGVRSNRSADLVGAFVNGELRGVASPTSTSGQKLYFVTVYGAAGDGVVTFKAYDAARDEVIDLSEGTTFAPDAVRGSLSQPFVVSTLIEIGSGINAPDWSVDAAGFGLTMSVVGSLVVDGVANTHASSRVAAFVGEDLRGVAAPLVVGGRSLFFLTVYANGVGEEITFRAYDAVADRLRGVSPSLTFSPDALEGSTSAPFVWRTTAGANRPPWTPDPTGFTQTMSLTASLLINGEVSTHPDNIVAAFVGPELRGSASPEVADGHLVFPMTLYANASGETLRFEAYDAAADRVRPVLETIPFAAGTSVGTPAVPYIFSTAVDPPQAAPVLLSPIDGAIDVQLEPSLVWDAVPRAAVYEVQLATAQDFVGATVFGNLASTSLTPADALALSSTYFWRVRGANPGADGPWSETRRFTTVRPSIGNEDDGTEMPNAFALDQNHPNPFNPTTLIRYNLASTVHVRLVVHDLLGRTVATLVNSVQSSGRYSVRFDSDGIGSGLYVYRIEAGSYTAARSMTLLR